jgi:hypothetical protein
MASAICCSYTLAIRRDIEEYEEQTYNAQLIVIRQQLIYKVLCRIHIMFVSTENYGVKSFYTEDKKICN